MHTVQVGIYIFVAVVLVSFQSYGDAQANPEGEAPLKSAEEYRIDGDQFVKNQDYEAAINSYSLAIEVEPSNYLNYFKRAIVYMFRGRNAKALDDLNKSLEYKSDFIQGRSRRGKALVSVGRLSEAKNDFEFILQAKPDNDIAKQQLKLISECETHVSNAERLISTRPHDALPHLDKVLECSPDSVETRLKRATVCLQLNLYNTVIEDTMRILKQKGDHLEALFLRGNAFYFLGEIEAALNHYREALRFDPENKKCKAEYKKLKKFVKAMQDGDKYFAEQKFSEALESFVTAYEADPSNQIFAPSLQLKQCKSLVKLRRGKEAIDACKRALQLDNNLLEAIIYEGEAYLLLEQYDEAVSAFQRAKERDPMNHEVNEGFQRAQRLLKMAKRKDYYKILGVSKTAQASEIRRAYRQLALEWHPDKHTDKEVAEAKFIEINEAYEVLSDDEKRRRFDNGEDVEVPHGGHGGDPFGFPFGGNPFGGGFTFNFRRG